MMNLFLLAAAAMALICTAGHAIAGVNMFYRPILATITGDIHAGVFRAVWNIVTIHFMLTTLALLVASIDRQHQIVAWLAAAQFTGYAATYLVISMRLGSVMKLFQWIPFLITAALATAGAVT